MSLRQNMTECYLKTFQSLEIWWTVKPFPRYVRIFKKYIKQKWGSVYRKHYFYVQWNHALTHTNIYFNCRIKKKIMKLYQDRANTGTLIETIKTREDINTCTMMYHSVTVPFSQFRISNFNTDIDEYLNTRN